MNASLIALSLALAASPSRLGGYFADSDSVAAQKIYQACPRVALFVLPDAMVLNAINTLVSSGCAQTQIIVRVSEARSFLPTDDPAQSALTYWNRINGSLTPVTGRNLWLEGPVESEVVPDWSASEANAQWAAKFFSRFADYASNAGYKPIVGGIASGAPKLAGELSAGSENLFKPIATAMKAKTYTWAWSYHSFSKDLSRSSADEAGTTLRYRRIAQECGLGGTSLFITAAGQASPGWLKAGTTATAYLEWLDWFDARLSEDGVGGAALYQLGGTAGTQADFELATLADGLVALLKSGPRDAGVDAPPATALDGGTVPPAGKDASSGGQHLPPGGGGTPAPERTGCSSAGVGSTALFALAAYLFGRRRR